MNIEVLKKLAQAATPGPWTAKDAPGAGLEIYADVPSQLGMPSREWPAFSTANADCKTDLVAYETWVQFPSEKLKNVQARNAAFIAAANPAAILSLIASHDQLVAALIGARESVQANRDALYECHYEPHTGDVDAEGRDAVDAEDALLSRIDAALKTAGAA